MSFARAEIYLRPVAQYTWLPASYRKSDTAVEYNNNPYSIPENQPLVAATHHTASGSGFGGGLAIGAALGHEHNIEIGGEYTLTRFDGSYTSTPLQSNDAAASYLRRLEAAGPASTHPCTFDVRTILATYRQFFAPNGEKIRPYITCVLGFMDCSINEAEIQPGAHYYDYKSDGGGIVGGLGGGASIRLGRKTCIEAGYRFMFTPTISSSSTLYRQSHTLSLALNQHF